MHALLRLGRRAHALRLERRGGHAAGGRVDAQRELEVEREAERGEEDEVVREHQLHDDRRRVRRVLRKVGVDVGIGTVVAAAPDVVAQHARRDIHGHDDRVAPRHHDA
eukprot:4348527-Prymnesium_polylepis.1